MARLNIKWNSKSSIAPTAAATGEAKADEKAGRRYAEKPMLVYVQADDATNAFARKLEDVCFADERVAIGSKFFDCVKVTNGNALQDRLLAKHGKKSPRLLVVTRDYTVVSVLEGKKLSSGKIVKAMSGAVRKEYKNSFDSMVSKYAKLLNELDRLEGVKAIIADKRNRADGNAAKLKKIDREQKKYEADMKKWEESEKKLLAFKLKELKKPKV